MVPIIKRHDLGAGRVMDYFRRCTHDDGEDRGEASIHAIEESLPKSLERSAEIKALAGWIKEPQEDRRVGLIASDAAKIDPLSVIQIRRLVCELEPEWVAAVQQACRYTNVVEEIADEAGCIVGLEDPLDLNAVVAIVTVLIEKGALVGFEIEGEHE